MSEVCVRVAVRIRPLIPREVLHNHQVCVRVVPDTARVMLGTDRAFSFDHAFGPTATQGALYESCVRPLVSSLVEGYNATVFAYGQTGSGKTYTLGGGHVASVVEEYGGIIERMAHDVFLVLQEEVRRTSGVGVEATVRVSYLELYKEELRDLLELHVAHKDLHIREDEKGNTLVVGAREMAVSSAEELLSVLEAGNALRHTGATGMNERSSRSHAILTLQLTQRHHDDRSPNSSPSIRYSKLHLVDLAGAERAGKTGNTGTRLKESVHINTGLLALGNVIRALSDPNRHRRGNNNHNHVPYRDAKITRLLRDSLGGSAHTLMVACVSPSDHDMAETLSVLQFASRARHIRNRPGTSCPRSEVKSCPTWNPRDARIGELEYEVQTLREALREKERELEREKGRGGGGNVTDNSKQADQTDRTCDPDRKLNKEEGLQHRLLAQEAALLLEDIPIHALSPSLKQRLEDWQERLRAINHSDHTDIKHLAEAEDQSQHVTILQLRQALNECQEALAEGEQVFEQKEEELREVQKEVQKVLQDNKSHLQSLEEAREHTRIQCDQLVEQQMLINRLRGENLTSRVATSGVSVEAKHSGNPAGRPHSVPLIRHSCGHGPVRKIHTSPPAYSLERVMAAFKIRGQLLLAEIKEKDEVYCPFIKQLEEEERKEEWEDEEEENEDRTGFRRSMNRTWISRQKKPAQSQDGTGPPQNGKSGILLPQRTKLTTGDESGAKQGLKEAGLNASVTQRRIQELSINMRMKEELINELDNTGRKAREADRHGRHGDDRSVAGPTKCVLARLSLQSRQARAELQQSLKHMRRQREQLQTSLRQERDTTNATAQLDQSRELRAEDLTVVPNGDDEGLKDKTHHHLEAEEEVVLQRRAELQELEEELRRREEVLQRREACLQQRNKLEIKRLRSSQALSQDLLRVSARLECLEEQLEGSSEAEQTGVTSLELERERDALRLRREALDTQLREGRVLTAQEEHALLQLEEAIEALDTAVNFKSRSIQDRQKQLSVTAPASQSHSADSAFHCDVIRKLRELSPPEASELLVKYFNKVVRLREEERRLRLHCEDLRLQSGEQEGLARELEAALQRLALDTDRRLTQQRREHQLSIQLLLQQLRGGAGGAGETGETGETEQALQTRVQQLEKDLFFYKSASRQLKKKLKELLDDSLQPSQPDPQPSHTHPMQAATQNHQKYTNRTYTQMHTQTQNKQTDTQTHAHQNPCSSSSSDPQTHKRTLTHTQIHTDSMSPGREVGGEGHSVQRLDLKSVRLSRRELRQIDPADLQLPSSTTRGRHSVVVKTSTESILEDSIEISRNTDSK